ncbi:uncharacterized protein AC631_02192 [Debaryomyces fabryi]|uniref:XPG-I domain-containing protein n=1 Tax=Debaryomyces fabryi TaxID=58627 RepID=A0A0V1Q0U9_9ASCO|nr:uncharacterized protein AC631_02192 [Debaryomyces fabryi]KSA02050.1 hypothetical protein AC631_02192 [Debaryomyces fabryi]CUM46041.1 unnamed protein product [Debaryomyces fabryi]
MGITDLWSILSPGFDTRIPFPIFVYEFINQYGRTPRIAIDAYMFIFQSSHSNLQGVERENDIQIRNIMSKLMYLTLLNVSYVVVFDGRYKPQKLRHGEDGHSISYDDQLREFQNIAFKNENYMEDSPCTQLINRLFEIFRENKIDFIQSPGEAEAECAMLQKYDVVDFVLTKDTDVFVFGATKVLRNFSRSEQDIAVSSSSIPTKDFYVTPVDMTRVTKETGLDYQRLILIATLRGGDYSSGVNNIGITRASKIALCGTKFATFFHLSPRKTKKKSEIKYSDPLRDFSKLLIDCFIDRACLNTFDSFALIKCASTRKIELERFTSYLNQCIESRSRDIFDMDINFSSSLFIDEYFTLLYLFPIVSPAVFKFLPYTLSCGELNVIDNDLKVPESCFTCSGYSKTWIEQIPRFNNILVDKYIGFLEVSMHIDELGKAKIKNCVANNSQAICKRMSKFMIPDRYDYQIKSIIIKLISWFNDISSLCEIITITNNKFINNVEFLMVKFEPEKIKNTLNSTKNFTTGSPEKGYENLLPTKEKLESLWLPKNLVELINLNMVQEFEASVIAHEKERRKQSPRKSKCIQRTTLDTLGLLSKKQRNEFSVENNNLRDRSSPLKIRDASKAKSRKNTIIPGQSIVTSFFPNYKNIKEDNPFIEKYEPNHNQDLLFVKDLNKGENKVLQNNTINILYGKLKLDIWLNPNLRYEAPLINKEVTGSPKRRIPSFSEGFSSPQSSPSKKRHVKTNLLLSPNSSPIKHNSRIDEDDGAFFVPVEKNSSPKTRIDITNNVQSGELSETKIKSGSTNLDAIQISDSDSEIDTSSLMEINLSAFQSKS